MKPKSSLSRIAFAMAIPLALQRVIASLVNLMDTVMLGQLGDVQIAATAQANHVFFLIVFAVGGISGGSNILAAQSWGQRDASAIHRILAYTYRIALAFALLVSAAAVFFPAAVMRVYTPDAAVVAEGVRYLRIIGFSYVFYTITTVTAGALQATHAVRISMVGSAVALVVNVLGNWVFIFGNLGAPEMGVAGAALATTLARGVEFGIVLFYTYRVDKNLKIRVHKLLKLDRSLAKVYIATSAPVILNEVFWAFGDSALAILMGRLGTAMVAGNGLAGVAVKLTSVLTRGLTAACCVMVANAVGAGKTEELPAQKRYFQRLSVGMGLLSGLVIFLARPLLLGVYNVGPETLAFANLVLVVESVISVFRSYQIMNMAGILRGGGDVRFAMMNDLVFLWGFAVPLGFLTGLWLHWTPIVVYCVIKFDQVIKCFTSEIRLRQGKWMTNRLVRETGETGETGGTVAAAN